MLIWLFFVNGCLSQADPRRWQKSWRDLSACSRRKMRIWGGGVAQNLVPPYKNPRPLPPSAPLLEKFSSYATAPNEKLSHNDRKWTADKVTGWNHEWMKSKE